MTQASQGGRGAGLSTPSCGNPLPVPTKPKAAAWSGWGSVGVWRVRALTLPCPPPCPPFLPRLPFYLLSIPALSPSLPHPLPCLVPFPRPCLCLFSHFPSPPPLPRPHSCLSPSLLHPCPCFMSPSLPPPIPAYFHPCLSPLPACPYPCLPPPPSLPPPALAAGRAGSPQPRGTEVPVAGAEPQQPGGGLRAPQITPTPPHTPPFPGPSTVRPSRSRITPGEAGGGGRLYLPAALGLAEKSLQNRDLFEKAETLPEAGEGALQRQGNTCGKYRETENRYIYLYIYTSLIYKINIISLYIYISLYILCIK